MVSSLVHCLLGVMGPSLFGWRPQSALYNRTLRIEGLFDSEENVDAKDPSFDRPLNTPFIQWTT